MMEIRQVLTMNAEERTAAKLKNPEIARRAGLLFNGGKICGQCNHFSQIGTRQGSIRNTGLNGNCRLLERNEYIKPERVACTRFQKGGAVK